MKITELKIKNFKALKEVEMKEIQEVCIVIGGNGTGKKSLFQVFQLLQEMVEGGISKGIARVSEGRGYKSLYSRGSRGPMEFSMVLQQKEQGSKISYEVKLEETGDEVRVIEEKLSVQKLPVFTLKEGKGVIREEHVEVPKDMLGLKYLSERSKVLGEVREFFERVHVSDIDVKAIRRGAKERIGVTDRLLSDGSNLVELLEYYCEKEREILDDFMHVINWFIPEITDIKVDEGNLVFCDRTHEDGFLVEDISDGTLAVFANFIYFFTEKNPTLMCVQKGERHLYPNAQMLLVDYFRSASRSREKQMFFSTHSPSLATGVNVVELYWLEKANGYSIIRSYQDEKELREPYRYRKIKEVWESGDLGKVDRW